MSRDTEPSSRSDAPTLQANKDFGGVYRLTRRTSKVRADRLMVDRGLAETRERAQALIMEGVVYTSVDRIQKPGTLVGDNVEIEVRGRLPFVSRGGTKLNHALEDFSIDVNRLVTLDVGASTGGFTDCLLQRGASKVYAVDVGRGQIDYKLRTDDRVEVIEKTNARFPFPLPEKVDLITIDVSFISLTMVIPPVIEHLAFGRNIVALVKPQFEAKKEKVGKGGIIKDPKVHAAVLGSIVNWAVGSGLRLRKICRSPILGDAGNREFFVLLEKPINVHANT